MTKRRSIIALFLAVAILALGVGYATLTDTLSIKTTVTSPNFEAKVYFSAAALDESNATNNVGGNAIDATVSTIGTNTDVITINNVTGLDAVGDVLVVKCTIMNATAMVVNVTPDVLAKVTTGGTGSDVFDCVIAATAADAKSGTPISAAFEMTASATKDIYVGIKLNKIPDADTTATFDVNFTVTGKTAGTP